MENETLMQKTILFEMDGKNQAIHEYDKMIWVLRTGFLTVFFAIWGLLIKSIIDNGGISNFNQLFDLMAILGIVITLGALIVDSNYVRRKYRVIKALNKLYKTIIEVSKVGSPGAGVFKEVLQISGTTSDIDPGTLKGTGYWRDMIICLIVYLMPLIALLIGFVLLSK
jgi:hypothetical protein